MTTYRVTENTWIGGYYEAAIVLGKVTDLDADQRLRSAIISVWSNAIFSLKSDRSLGMDRPVSDLETTDPETLSGLLGIISHPTFGDIPCSTIVVREEGEDPYYDWLYIGIPLGGLSEAVPEIGGWPFGDLAGSRKWREPLENMLSALVMDVSKSVDFPVAAIGYEVAGLIPDNIIAGNSIDDELNGYVVRKKNSYTYFPTQNWDV